MNTKLWMIPLSAVMIIGLTGCTSNNRAGVNENQNSVQPMGYYSNENHPSGNRNGLFVDNDGPITEFMDHTFGTEGKLQAEQSRRTLQTRDENGNPPNPTVPLATTDKNIFQRDNRFSMSDSNYHGHMNNRIGNAGVITDAKFQDKVSNQIRNKVATLKNVRTVRSVVYGNYITVSVNLNDHRRAAETKRAIEKAVKPYADGRPVMVVTDEGAIGRYRNQDNHYQQLDWPHYQHLNWPR